jgi:hypothetical protein
MPNEEEAPEPVVAVSLLRRPTELPFASEALFKAVICADIETVTVKLKLMLDAIRERSTPSSYCVISTGCFQDGFSAY